MLQIVMWEFDQCSSFLFEPIDDLSFLFCEPLMLEQNLIFNLLTGYSITQYKNEKATKTKILEGIIGLQDADHAVITALTHGTGNAGIWVDNGIEDNYDATIYPEEVKDYLGDEVISNLELVYLGACRSMENTNEASKWFNIGSSDHPMAVVGWKGDHFIISEFLFQLIFWPILKLGFSVQESVEISWILAIFLSILVILSGIIIGAIGMSASPFSLGQTLLGSILAIVTASMSLEIIEKTLIGDNFGPDTISNTGESVYVGGLSIL